MGTVINALAVIIATFLGLIFKRGLNEVLQKKIMFVLGLALSAMALGWFLSDFLVVESDGISTRYDLLIIISLVIGSIIGTAIDIDGRLTRFAHGIETRYNLPPLAKGFIAGTLIFCVGAMAILGPIQDGLTGDMTTLLVKSLLDFITAMMLASVFGVGVAFAAISILIYQGSITILAIFLGAFLTSEMIMSVAMIGNILLVAMGMNFMELKQIKVANMLPSLVIPIIYFFILNIFI